MAEIPTTSTTLLRDIAQDSQHARWTEFVARYRPMMEAYMRERFPSLDADDAIQETLVAVCRVMPSYRYDPESMAIPMFSFHDAFAALAREICIERGVLSLESCGANPLPRFRRAAIRCGNKRTLERVAVTDPDSEIRTEAYEKLQNPSQMLSARYLAQITENFSGDIGEPIKVIEKMTDRAALEFIAENAALEYFRDLAKEGKRRIMDYGIDRLESAGNPLVLFRGIVGSRAYGTQNANSNEMQQ